MPPAISGSAAWALSLRIGMDARGPRTRSDVPTSLMARPTLAPRPAPATPVLISHAPGTIRTCVLCLRARAVPRRGIAADEARLGERVCGTGSFRHRPPGDGADQQRVATARLT